MITLNHILLFLALVSPLAVLARAWRPGEPYRGWRIAAILVLAITGAAWLLSRHRAGYIGGAAWIILLFLPAVGMRRIAELSARQQYGSARKLGTILTFLHPSNDLRRQVELLRMLEARQAAGTALPPLFVQSGNGYALTRLRNAPAVLVLIFSNVAVFLAELTQHPWSNYNAFHRLGALEPAAVVWQHQYWRLFTALFLHYDVLHILFNLFALYILGPPLERAIGSARFCICYLLSGLGSSAGVVILWMSRNYTMQLVGASGCIMGIVGAWAAFLLRHRRSPLAAQRLWNVLMIVAIQVAFDLATPQVSMAAHLCGLATGFLVGLFIAPHEATTEAMH